MQILLLLLWVVAKLEGGTPPRPFRSLLKKLWPEFWLQWWKPQQTAYWEKVEVQGFSKSLTRSKSLAVVSKLVFRFYEGCSLCGRRNLIFCRRNVPLGTGKWLVVIYNICMSEGCIINIFHNLERFWIRFRYFASAFSFRKTSFSEKSGMQNQNFYIKLS